MLENYFQNSRRYVKSLDTYQLLGRRKNDELAPECEPYRYHLDDKNPNIKLKYTPCGAIANSIFNGK
jgi:hypothetical protein